MYEIDTKYLLDRLPLNNYAIVFPASLLFLLLLWRLWTFTIIPSMRRDQPKELPYWIPFLGHAVAFFQDPDGLLTYGRTYFGNTREPFTITVAGEKLVILTSAEDAAAAYKNNDLKYDVFVQDLFKQLSMSPSSLERIYQSPEHFARDGDDQARSLLQNENPLHKCLLHFQSDLYKQQLHPGEKLDLLQDRFLGYINDHMRWESFSPVYVLPSASDKTSSGEETISLYKWCQEVLVDSASRTFFGDKLLEIDPTFTQTFSDYDDNSWKLLYQYPQILAKDAHGPKTKMLDTLETYLKLPKESRSDASWLIQTIEAEQRQIGNGDRDIAIILMSGYWVINSNAWKLCFWMLAYILHHPTLLSTLRAETLPAIIPPHSTSTSTPPSTTINMPHLLTHCPHLSSTYDEVLRLTNSAAAIRTVSHPTTLGTKTIPPNSKIMTPFRQLHFDAAVFGPDPDSFDPDRFHRDKDLARSKSYRPFGGGTTYCPGRFVARQEVFMFVVVVLQRFEVRLAGLEGGRAQAFPRLDRKKPSLGIMGPVRGADVLLRVKPAVVGR